MRCVVWTIIVCLFSFSISNAEEWKFLEIGQSSGIAITSTLYDEDNETIYALSNEFSQSSFETSYAIEKFQGVEWERITRPQFNWDIDPKIVISAPEIDKNGNICCMAGKYFMMYDGVEWHKMIAPTGDTAIRETDYAEADNEGNIYFVSAILAYQGEYSGTKIYNNMGSEVLRWNGEEIEILFSLQEVSNMGVAFFSNTNIKLAPDGSLWCASFHNTQDTGAVGGLFQISGDTILVHDLPIIMDKTNFHDAACVDFDEDGNLWILYEHIQGDNYNFSPSYLAKYEDGEWIIPGEEEGYVAMRYFDNMAINADDGIFLVKFHDGLYYYDYEDTYSIDVNAKTGRPMIDFSGIYSTENLNDGRILFGTKNGIIEYTPGTSSVEKTFNPDLATVYPNPVVKSGHFNIRIDNSNISEKSIIKVIDINGKILMELVTTENNISIPAGKLSSGTYHIEISCESSVCIRKLIVE